MIDRLDVALKHCNDLKLRNNKRLELKKNYRTIYLIECKGYYKPGYAWNLYQRLCTFKVHNPFEITLVAFSCTTSYKQYESWMSQHYANHHVSGEWFKLSVGDVVNVKNEWFV